MGAADASGRRCAFWEEGMLIVVKDEWLVVRVYETKLCERCVWWWISCEFGKRR